MPKKKKPLRPTDSLLEARRISEYPTLVVVDLETTGLDHRVERIIEIGMVRLENGEVTEKYETLVNPDVPIRHSSFNIHGISEEMVADAPKIEDVLPTVLEFLGDAPLVAHNAIFDYSYLNEASKRMYEKRIENLRIDTFEIFRNVFPDEPSHGLSALLAKFGYESDVLHRALDDAENLARVFPKLIKMYEEQKAWQLLQVENVPYLAERYSRLQRTVQMLQAEISDLREIFKLYFQEGGKSFTTTQGDMLVSSYRRNYEYNEEAIRTIIDAAGLGRQAYKLNNRAVDKLINNKELDDDIRQGLIDARTLMTEARMVSFVKPSDVPKAEPTADAEEESDSTT